MVNYFNGRKIVVSVKIVRTREYLRGRESLGERDFWR